MYPAIARALAVAALLLCTLPAAAADDAERPWAAGVPADTQKRATDLFEKGNELLKDSIFAQAAVTYREALQLWDHPAIHYNLVLALLNLDQPVDVRHHLEKAMRFGAAPLGDENFDKSKGYLALVEKQLVKLTIACAEPEAEVKLDGRTLFTAPGNWEDWVRAGPHTVLATKPGKMPTEVSRTMTAGDNVQLMLELKDAAQAAEYRRRWDTWIPWTVFSAGAVVALAGGGMHLTGMGDVEAFDTEVESCGGCVPSPAVTELKTGGESMQQLGVTAYAVGGAALVTGSVLLYLNRSIAYVPGTDIMVDEDAAAAPGDGEAAPPVDGDPTPAPAPASDAPEASLLPFAGPGAAGLTALIRF